MKLFTRLIGALVLLLLMTTTAFAYETFLYLKMHNMCSNMLRAKVTKEGGTLVADIVLRPGKKREVEVADTVYYMKEIEHIDRVDLYDHASGKSYGVIWIHTDNNMDFAGTAHIKASNVRPDVTGITVWHEGRKGGSKMDGIVGSAVWTWDFTIKDCVQ